MKYSIIVPVYGVEQYLDQCVQSVLAQSFADFEMILVDDNSPDNCPAMCDSWAEKDSRIRVIHKPQNEGLGFARNTGLEYVRGQYVLFLDSDDYVSPDLLESCNNVLQQDTDIVVFGVEYVYQNKQGSIVLREKAVPEAYIADNAAGRAALFATLNRCGAFPYAWNKIYAKRFLDEAGTLFEKTKLIEDFLFNIDLFGKASSIVALNKALYYYRRPAHETLVSKYAPEFFELCKRKYLLEEQFLIDCGSLVPEYAELIRLGYVKHFVSTVIKNRSKAAGLSLKEQKQAITHMARDPLTQRVLEGYSPADLKYRVVTNAVRNQQAGLVLAYCSAIDFVQQNMRSLYRKLLKKG